MKIIEWTDNGPGWTLPPTAATIGVFDGLHLGHRALVSRVVNNSTGLVPMAVTFRTNPKKMTKPQRFHGDIFNLDQKLAALESAGVHLCILIDFSGNFSKLHGTEFVSILVQSFGVRSFVVGHDFRCGHNLSTDAMGVKEAASAYGLETEIVEPVSVNGHIVSSSSIRTAIMNGRTDLALAMLGRPYTLDLRSFEMTAAGTRRMVNMPETGYVVPATGRYHLVVGSRTNRCDTIATVDGNGLLDWESVDGCNSAGTDFIEFGPRCEEYRPHRMMRQ